MMVTELAVLIRGAEVTYRLRDTWFVYCFH